MPLRARPALLLAAIALAVFLPLFGASLVLVLQFDQVVLPHPPKIARAVNRA